MDDIAKKFGVQLVELQVHALMHTPIARMEEDGVEQSIAAGMKKGEANMLYAAAEEYFSTLRQTGKEIRQRIKPLQQADLTDDKIKIKALPSEMVELYIGCGGNLRQIITSIADINQKVNGEGDPALKALEAIVKAVRGGTPPAPAANEDDED
jgi:uncharacterized protein YukE